LLRVALGRRDTTELKERTEGVILVGLADLVLQVVSDLAAQAPVEKRSVVSPSASKLDAAADVEILVGDAVALARDVIGQVQL